MRKTKIICTIGPASEDPKVFRQMCLAGMNVARLNFSHGTHEQHQEKIDMIKAVREELKLPIAIYRIEGGYGVHPRWSDVVRKGKMRSYVSRVIEPQDYADLTDDELFAIIEKELFVDESGPDSQFISEKRAEYLERAMYVCPDCGFSVFESRGNCIKCTTCQKEITYGKDKALKGNGFDFPFPSVSAWYDYQKDFVNSTDVTTLTQAPIFKDRANMFEVVVYKRKELLRKDCSLSLYGDRMVIDEGGNEMCLPFSEITAIAVLGRNKLNVYHDKKVYQFKGGKRFNALKYVNICFRYKNIAKGDNDGKFLGL